MTRLADITTFAQEVANAFTAVLNIDVQMIDDEGRLIAGTGVYKDLINEVFDTSTANAYVTQHQIPIIIENAKEHKICSKCVYFNKCKDLAEICYPILIDQNCLGVIALIATNEEQRKKMLTSKKALFLFLEKMTRMLSYVIKSYELNTKIAMLTESQKTIMNSIQEGLLSIDANGVINYVNQSAAVLFGIPQEQLLSRPINTVFQSAQDILSCISSQKTMEMEFFTVPNLNSRHFIGTVTPILSSDAEPEFVVCFRDISSIPKMVQNYLRKERIITFNDILGKSPAIQQVKQQAFMVAQSDSSVLITGESGTGKEMFARAIHYASSRNNGPLISINSGAIPEGLLESELFGYEEGAFTGAKKGGKPGQFELANNGTLFLDEIGDIPLHLQVKLLRVLEEKQVQRVGGTKPFFVNARIIAATHRNLEELIKTNQFREDLYYRLSVIPLKIPSLCEHATDVKEYVYYFINKYNTALNKRIKSVSPQAMTLMQNYLWPGNVRELENVVEYAVNMEISDEITISSLPEKLIKQKRNSDCSNIKNIEKDLIEEALKAKNISGQSIEDIAQSLGMSRATLYRKIKKYGLTGSGH